MHHTIFPFLIIYPYITLKCIEGCKHCRFKMLSDTNIKLCLTNEPEWSFRSINYYHYSECCTVLFGHEISNEYCKQLDLYIKWKVASNAFFMGYFNQSMEYKNSTDYLGQKLNKFNSVGIEAYKLYNNFTISDEYNNSKTLNYCAPNDFKENDIFVLSFNFIDKQLLIYHNHNIAEILPLKHKKIIPAFSLRGYGDQIEIIKYEMFLHGT